MDDWPGKKVDLLAPRIMKVTVDARLKAHMAYAKALTGEDGVQAMERALINHLQPTIPSGASVPDGPKPLKWQEHPELAGQELGMAEVRLRLPVWLHMKLWTLRVLRGETMADIVTRALCAYYAVPEGGVRVPSTVPSKRPRTPRAKAEHSSGQAD